MERNYLVGQAEGEMDKGTISEKEKKNKKVGKHAVKNG